MAQRAFQAGELQGRDLVARGDLDRLEVLAARRQIQHRTSVSVERARPSYCAAEFGPTVVQDRAASARGRSSRRRVRAMLQLVRFTEISCLLLVALARAAAAQSPFPPPEPPPDLRANEIIENPAGFRITGGIAKPDGTIEPGLLVICQRDGAGGEATLVVQDLVGKTDDRMRVSANVCTDWLRICANARMTRRAGNVPQTFWQIARPAQDGSTRRRVGCWRLDR